VPTYIYEAIDASGATVTGTLNAADERAALTAVRELGLHPMSARPGAERAAGRSGWPT